MSKQQGSDARLDAAIDRAVHQMMDADAPPGLRRRVLARLEARAPGAAWWPQAGLAAAALAAVVLGVVFLRPAPVTDPLPQVAEVPARPAAEPAPQAPTAPGDRAALAETPAPAAVRDPRVEPLPEPPRMDEVFGPPGGRVAAASVGESPPSASGGAPPLPVLEPIIVPEIVIPPIEVQPLTVTPMVIRK